MVEIQIDQIELATGESPLKISWREIFKNESIGLKSLYKSDFID